MIASPPGAEFERRFRWPALPTLVFLGFLGLLLFILCVTLVTRPQHPRGLPYDDALLARAGLPAPGLGVLTSSLRFRAATFGGEPLNHTSDAAMLDRARAAEQQLAHWARRHPGEPRVHAALGALALARHDYSTAASRYRAACERSPHYAEGRLGWGVALALDAGRTTEPWPRRALMLRAIAQFAAVDRNEPEYPCALYNRVRLLAEVGRLTEARTFARAYLALDPASDWAARLRGDLLTH